MKTTIRVAVAAALSCLMFSAHAELFKCKQPDGSTAFQDYACGTAGPGPSSKPVPPSSPPHTLSPAARGSQPAPAGNPACAPETTIASKLCAPQYNEAINKCMVATLSPRCRQQPIEQRDDACATEIPQKLRQCLPSVNALRAQCIASNLPARCR